MFKASKNEACFLCTAHSITLAQKKTSPFGGKTYVERSQGPMPSSARRPPLGKGGFKMFPPAVGEGLAPPARETGVFPPRPGEYAKPTSYRRAVEDACPY